MEPGRKKEGRMNQSMNRLPVTLYYDGRCPLCSREIAHYRQKAVGDALRFIDITDPKFDAAEQELDAKRVHRIMHVKVGDELRVGLDAFIAVWDAIPSYRWLAKAARLPGLHALLTIGYHSFAVMRPWLPRRKRPMCESGTCRR
jgi:predicted DCC family thiol-disulfide oxidoreductase YuxK